MIHKIEHSGLVDFFLPPIWHGGCVRQIEGLGDIKHVFGVANSPTTLTNQPHRNLNINRKSDIYGGHKN